ncbi:hypothetical protein S83_009029, partial [Arachis hypogaea]
KSREGPDEDEDPDPVEEQVKAQSKQNGIQNGNGMKILPFECVALEAYLEATCSEAHLALDKLTSKISTLILERVRQIKGRLVAITNRVQKVRDELEHLSDDDDDMDEVYLTEKLQQLHSSSASSINDDDVDNDHHNQLDVDDRHVYMLLVGVSRDNRASTTYSTTTKHLDMEELEMLLEAYFVQINGTLNKLCT